ncbi:MAG: TolC family protein, partial [Acidiferrobacter sp.]
MRIPFCAARALVLALISAPGLAPIPAQALSLAAVETLAMQHNPTLAAARQDVVVARGLARQDRLWPNPRLSVSGGTGGVLGSPGEFSTRVMLTQAVPLTSRIARHVATGRAGVRRAQDAFETQAWQLRGRVARAYARWTSAIAAVTVAKKLVARDGILTQLVLARAHAAQISPLGVSSARLLQAQARLL